MKVKNVPMLSYPIERSQQQCGHDNDCNFFLHDIEIVLVYSPLLIVLNAVMGKYAENTSRPNFKRTINYK